VSVAVEPTAGAPRLEPYSGPLPRDDKLPPAPAAGPEPADGVPGGEEAPAPLWRPDEAALFVTGTHNLGGSVVLMREPPALRAWIADPAELDTAAPALARLLDRTPLSPAAGGAAGLLVDLVMSANAIIDLEARHIDAVRAARRRVARAIEREDAAPPPEPSPASYDVPTYRATPREAAAAAPEPPAPQRSGRSESNGRGFHFSREQLRALTGAEAAPHHGTVRAPDSPWRSAA